MALLSVVMTGIKSSEPYQQALNTALTNAVLINRIGSPIKPGRLITGEMSRHTTVGDDHTTTGSAELKIPLRGPRGKATLSVEAERLGEAWTLLRLEAVVKEERLNLLATPQPAD